MSHQKRTYAKPQITQIDLKGDEIFLANCKLTSGGAGTAGRSRASCSAATRCRSTRGTS